LLSQECAGAFLILQPDWSAVLQNQHPVGSPLPESEWVGASDFQIPAKSTTDVSVALTSRGQQDIQSTNGYSGVSYIVLRDYGAVAAVPGNTNLTLKLTTQ
jgi:hypothetical protein